MEKDCTCSQYKCENTEGNMRYAQRIEGGTKIVYPLPIEECMIWRTRNLDVRNNLKLLLGQD